MERAAAWEGPCDFQLATTNWMVEEPAAAAAAAEEEEWAAPAGGLPLALEYASIVDIFGTCSSLHAYVPESSLVGQQQQQQQQQQVEYNYNYNYNCYAAATQHDDDPIIVKAAAQEPFHQVDLEQTDDMEEYIKDPMHLFAEKAEELRKHVLMTKMHRYPSPPVMPDLGKQCKEPFVVAIGPYHHGLDHLQRAEKFKHAAANSCIVESGRPVEEVYGAVVSAVEQTDARDLYGEDVMAGIGGGGGGGDDDLFLPMMFYDACFLAQCVAWYATDPSHTKQAMDPSLVRFFEHNYTGIRHDLMLLENQIPWGVVEAVLNFRATPLLDLEEFVTLWKDSLQDRKAAKGGRSPRVALDRRYRAPHLLGLLRFYIVGRRRRRRRTSDDDSIATAPDNMNNLRRKKVDSLSFSVSPVELAEMGVFLRAKGETAPELAKMGFKRKRWFFFFADLSLPPLALTEARASRLANMAAHELCAATDFFSGAAAEEDSAVCSYLRALCMLVHREEDVQQLRARGVLQGAGLTDGEALQFFTRFQSLPYGPCYARVMDGVDRYRADKWLLIMVYGFFYRNWKTISAVLSGIGVIVGILLKLKPITNGH